MDSSTDNLTARDNSMDNNSVDVVRDDENYIELWDEYGKTGDVEARNELVLVYMDLVKKIALRFKASYSNYGQLDDMINQGMIALIDAVEKFEPSMGNKFETFATLKIKGAVIDFMRKQDWIPRNQRTLVKELNSAYEMLYSEFGREPTKDEIAEKMGVNGDQLERILQKRHSAMVLSYEESINEKMMTAFPLLETNSDRDGPEAELLREEMRGELAAAIKGLNEKERTVISLYYYENLKLREIAEVIDVTESRVSQIHSAAILKLRHKIEM
jgi:RNA polymerase sigma factor for flagellar operon FliA